MCVCARARMLVCVHECWGCVSICKAPCGGGRGHFLVAPQTQREWEMPPDLSA